MDEYTIEQAQHQPAGEGTAPHIDPTRALNNRIGADIWEAKVQGKAGPDAGSFELDFSEMVDLNKRQVLQEVLLHSMTGGMGWADKTHRLVATSEGHARHQLRAAKDIYQAWVAHYDSLALQSLSQSDIIQLLRAILESNSGDDGRPVSFRLINASRMLNASANLRAKGLASDGILHDVTDSVKRDVASPLLEPHGVRYEEWRASGSYGGIPIDVALVWLMEATEVIHARDTKILLAYFAAWRASPPASIIPDAALRALRQYRKYQRTGSCANVPTDNRAAVEAFGKAFDQQAKDAGIGSLDELPWRTIKETHSYCRLVRDAGSVILHLVAGNRVHEVAGYRTDQWKPDSKGVWWYRSAESKVNKGGNADRAIDPIGAEVVDILTNMSYLDPEVSRPVIGSTFSLGAMAYARRQRGLLSIERELADCTVEKAQKPLSTVLVRKTFSAFYQSHLVEKHHEIGKKHPHAHPHQARHFFADLALRWMDPMYVDIIAKLREHYRHKSDWMIHNYTDGKRSDDIQAEAERRYLIEILQRIAENNANDAWFGAAAKRVRNELRAITVVSPDELAEFYEEQAGLYARFVVWEWGICAVRIGEESKASCADSDTGMPNLIATDREKAPEVCNGCVHQLAHTGFTENIHRIALSCAARGKLLEELKRPYFAKKVGYEPAKKAEKLYQEMTS